MLVPLQITFRNMESSDAIEAKIREEVDKLETFFDHINSCRVVIEIPHHHHERGNLTHVRIDLTVPGKELVIKHEPSLHDRKKQEERIKKQLNIQAPHKDAYLAISDAFKTARRELQSYARRLRGEVKLHETIPPARVHKLFQDEGYGFIETFEGDEVYFHKNSLVNGDFEKLKVGTEVTFVEEKGDKGLQASTVKLIA